MGDVLTLDDEILWLCTHPRSRERAQGHNLLYDDAVDPARVTAFQTQLDSMSADPLFDPDLHDGHVILQTQARYFEDFVRAPAGQPTFSAENGKAALDGLADTIELIRLEDLRWPIRATKRRFGDLKRAFETPAEHATIEQFLNEWDRLSHDGPRFAALETELRDEVNAADWPERLCIRLGLAYLDSAPIPVALMRYRVSDVRKAVRRRADVQHVFARPTVLDQKPYEYFFPAPLRLNGGRCMELTLAASDGRLCTEYLHPKFHYKREHLAALGMLTTPAPAESLRQLRNRHLQTVRHLAGNDRFGEMIPDDVVD